MHNIVGKQWRPRNYHVDFLIASGIHPIAAQKLFEANKYDRYEEERLAKIAAESEKKRVKNQKYIEAWFGPYLKSIERARRPYMPAFDPGLMAGIRNVEDLLMLESNFIEGCDLLMSEFFYELDKIEETEIMDLLYDSLICVRINDTHGASQIYTDLNQVDFGKAYKVARAIVDCFFGPWLLNSKLEKSYYYDFEAPFPSSYLSSYDYERKLFGFEIS